MPSTEPEMGSNLFRHILETKQMELLRFYWVSMLFAVAIMPKHVILSKIFILPHRTANEVSKYMFSGSRNVYITLEFVFDTWLGKWGTL